VQLSKSVDELLTLEGRLQPTLMSFWISGSGNLLALEGPKTMKAARFPSKALVLNAQYITSHLAARILEVESHIGIADSFDLLINAENGKQHRYVVWRRNDASAWRSNNSIYRPLPSSPDIFWACRCRIRNSPRPSIYLPRASGFAGGPGTFDWLATVRTLRRAS
jgi:hypothetical protein